MLVPKREKKWPILGPLFCFFFFFFFFKYNRGSVNLWAKTTGSSLKRTLVPYSTFSGDRFSLLDQLDSWLSSAWKMLFYAFFGLKVPQKCFFWYTKWFFELVPKRRQFLSKRPQRFVAFKCLKNVILVFTHRFTEHASKHRTDGHQPVHGFWTNTWHCVLQKSALDISSIDPFKRQKNGIWNLTFFRPSRTEVYGAGVKAQNGRVPACAWVLN